MRAGVVVALMVGICGAGQSEAGPGKSTQRTSGTASARQASGVRGSAGGSHRAGFAGASAQPSEVPAFADGAARPVERPFDSLDRLFRDGGVTDLHADTALHGLALHGNGHPAKPMRMFMAVLKGLGVVRPTYKHFTRHVTEDSLRMQGTGVQVFSAVTRGLAPAYGTSMQLFTRLLARYSKKATESDVALWLTQSAWVYGQAAEHPDLLMVATDFDTTLKALQQGKIGAQLAIEGAFPFEKSSRNSRALERFFSNPKLNLPQHFPRPTQEEVSQGKLLHYARRLGVQYMSLNHLASSCFAGSDLRPNRNRGKGLSRSGKKLIGEASDAGIMIDLAHASRQTQLDVVDLVRANELSLPLLVSHAVFPLTERDKSWRTTLPEVLDAVRSTGGVVGIIGARVHLPHGTSRHAAPVVADIADQIDFVRQKVGVDFIALGLDGDGFVGQAHATTNEVAEAVRAELTKRAYGKADIAKIFGGNYLHVLARRDLVIRERTQTP